MRPPSRRGGPQGAEREREREREKRFRVYKEAPGFRPSPRPPGAAGRDSGWRSAWTTSATHSRASGASGRAPREVAAAARACSTAAAAAARPPSSGTSGTRRCRIYDDDDIVCVWRPSEREASTCMTRHQAFALPLWSSMVDGVDVMLTMRVHWGSMDVSKGNTLT